MIKSIKNTIFENLVNLRNAIIWALIGRKTNNGTTNENANKGGKYPKIVVESNWKSLIATYKCQINNRHDV